MTPPAELGTPEPQPLFLMGAGWHAAHTGAYVIWLFRSETRRLLGLDGMVYRRTTASTWSAYHPTLGAARADLARADATKLVECAACFVG